MYLSLGDNRGAQRTRIARLWLKVTEKAFSNKVTGKTRHQVLALEISKASMSLTQTCRHQKAQNGHGGGGGAESCIHRKFSR